MIQEIPGWLILAKEASLPALALAGIFFALSQFIKVLPQLKQNQAESDASLRAALLSRVDVLEEEVKNLRKALDGARISHASEMMDMLHDLASESAQLDAALLLAEHSPEALTGQLPKIREQRDEHRARMAEKRGVREATLLKTASSTGVL